MQLPNYLSDYYYRYSEDECHRDWHIWSAITLIGFLLGQRVWVNHGRFKAIPVLYTALVGEAGDGKSVAKDVPRDIMCALFPQYLLNDSIQSREDIIAQMAGPECSRCFKVNGQAKIEEYRPFFLLINEMAAFFSVDCRKMIEMLVDAFDAKTLSTGFKKDRKEGNNQRVEHPHLCMIGCVQPDWFMGNMKVDLFQRGLGRRMIIVNREKSKLNHNPQFPADSEEGWKRVVTHLIRINQDEVQGCILFTPDAAKWFEAYYYDEERRKKSEDPIIVMFQKTEHMVLLRVALCLSFCEYAFQNVITVEHLETAQAMLEANKPGIMKLTGGIGTNPMAGVMVEMEEFIRVSGGRPYTWEKPEDLPGCVRYKRLLSTFLKNCPRGQQDFDNSLVSMTQMEKITVRDIFVEGLPVIKWVFTKESHERYQQEKGKK